MKGKGYITTYLSALVIGILLLIYHDREALYNTVVLVTGVLILIPSIVLLISELVHKIPQDPHSGYLHTLKWISIMASLVGIAFGVWMIAEPAFFVNAIIYTLGAILILVAVIQIASVYIIARPYRPVFGWFIIPLLTLIAGVIIIFLGPDKVTSAAGLVTGIMLVVYAANGFASTGREAKIVSKTAKVETTVAIEHKDEAAEKKEESAGKE